MKKLLFLFIAVTAFSCTQDEQLTPTQDPLTNQKVNDRDGGEVACKCEIRIDNESVPSIGSYKNTWGVWNASGSFRYWIGDKGYECSPLVNPIVLGVWYPFHEDIGPGTHRLGFIHVQPCGQVAVCTSTVSIRCITGYIGTTPIYSTREGIQISTTEELNPNYVDFDITSSCELPQDE